MTLLEHSKHTIEQPTAVAPVITEGDPSTGSSDKSPRRWALTWILIVVALAGLATLVIRLVGDDGSTDNPVPLSISDPKDRPGYRSPTITRELTTGDPKDHAGYQSATAPTRPRSPAVRTLAPIGDWDETSGSPFDPVEDQSATGPTQRRSPAVRTLAPIGDWVATTGDPKDHAGYQSATVTSTP